MKKFGHKISIEFYNAIIILSATCFILLFVKNTLLFGIIIALLFLSLILIFKYSKKHNKGLTVKDNILYYEKNIYIRRINSVIIQFLIISLVFYIMNIKNIDDAVIIIILITYFGFLFFSYMTYPYKNTYIKTIPIIISTPIGMIILTFLLVGLCILIDKTIIFLSNYIDITISYITVKSDISEIILDTLPLIASSEKDMGFWIFSTIVFLVLNFIYIISTPKYYLTSIKSSYNIVAIAISLITTIAVLTSSTLSEKLLIFINDHHLLLQVEKSVAKYFENFSDTNMKNIITLALIPYSLGLILCNILVNFRINRSTNKKDFAAKNLLTETNENMIEKYKKEFLINGGKPIELDYIDQIRINSCNY